MKASDGHVLPLDTVARFRETARTIDVGRRVVTPDVINTFNEPRAMWLKYRQAAVLSGDFHVLFPDYVGPVYPRVVLVGDTPGKKMPSYGAFTPWHDGCGEYLMNALLDAGLSLETIGLVNSLDTNLDRMFIELESPRMIALGQMALSRLNAYDLPVSGFLYHPQYEKRFRHKHRATYGAQIKELATPFTRTW